MSRRTIEEHDGDPECCALCRSLATFILDGRTPLSADHLDLAMEYGPAESAQGGNVATDSADYGSLGVATLPVDEHSPAPPRVATLPPQQLDPPHFANERAA